MMKFARSGIFSIFFIALLVLAAFSLILTDWTGSFRSGVGSTEIATVAGEQIGQNEFARLVQRTLQNENVNPQQAYQLGLIHQVLTTEIWQRMLMRAAYGYGLAVPDDVLLANLQKMAAPIAAQEKTTPAVVIKRFIEAQGLSEAAFLETMRREMVNTRLRDIVAGAAAPSVLMTRDLARIQGQTRTIDYVVFHDDDVTGIAPPSDAVLAEYYERRKGEFMLPERRDFRIGILPRTSIEKNVTVTDDEIATFYQDHLDAMNRPEARRVHLVTYTDLADAQKFRDTVKPGDDLLAAAKKAETAPARTDTQEFTADAPVPEALKPILAAANGDVIGPVETAFGTMIAQVAEIIPARTDTLAQARDKITAQIKDDKISTLIDAKLEELDRAHETGTSFETVMTAHKMTVTPYTGIAREGDTDAGTDAFKENGKIKAAILAAAFAGPDTGRVSAPIELADGDIGVVIVDRIAAARPKELAVVRDVLVREWLVAEKKKANVMAMQAELPDLVAGTVTVKATAAKRGRGIETLSDVKMDQPELPSNLDRAAWNRLFRAEQGKPIFQTVPKGVMLAVVTEVKLPEQNTITTENLDQVRAAVTAEMHEEQITQYLGALNERYDAKVNDRLLKRMYDRAADAGQ